MPTVPPFIQQIIGSVVRVVIVWLAAQFGAELSEDEIVKWTAQVLPIVLVVGWSIWQKYRGRQKLLMAAASPQVLSEKQVEGMVAAGLAPPVNTPKDQKP